MDLLKFLIKTLIILAFILLMDLPFIIEYITFRQDKDKKISYKRFRVVVFTGLYTILITIAMYLLKELVLWLQNQSFVQWIAGKLALSGRTIYLGEVLAAILMNFGIGILFTVLSKLVRIGLKKKNLTKPQKNGKFNWRQKAERAVIRFFHNETWFLVGSILKYLSLILSSVYALVFIIYQIPAMFEISWLPYDKISVFFGASYAYPVITLLGLWQMYFFLAGIQHLKDECPELVKEEDPKVKPRDIDIQSIDEEVRKQFQYHYACDVDLSDALQQELCSSEHHPVTRFIARAVENDQRNPQVNKEPYLDCIDRIAAGGNSIVINGEFFSEFSMYFLRYLSVIIARGDNVVFVCNSDDQIDNVYDYVRESLCQLSSLYCKGFRQDPVDFDDPIWRIIKVSGEHDMIEEAALDDNSILVTSLSYLCSNDFENCHSRFIHLIDTMVFVDTPDTVNRFDRQLAMLNTRLKHITKLNAQQSQNSSKNKNFRVRYMSRQVRYICFDPTRTPGMDKVLKNMLSVDFESVDAMCYNPQTIVRCYNYESRPGDNADRPYTQYYNTPELVSPVMNMATLCLAKGASSVTVFTGESIPYGNIAETIASNSAQVSVKTNADSIRLNKPFYNPDAYSVIIAMDSGSNLPAALRRYISMVSDKPALVIIFSRPYMLRDYYLSNISKLWSNTQLGRIPVESGTDRDIARNILIKANAGGISETEIFRLVSGIPKFAEAVKSRNVNAILREILTIYGLQQEDRIDLFKHFEYTTCQDFDKNGIYRPETRVLLRHQGKLYDMISGLDTVVMCAGEREIKLPLPKDRLTQNHIAGQNLLYNGNIYRISQIDTDTGRIYAYLAMGGKNEEPYQYIQSREYRIHPAADRIEYVFPDKHVLLKAKEDSVCVDDIYVSAFRAPAEVLTNGYYEVDPRTLALNVSRSGYHTISDSGSDALAKQTYRRYGTIENPVYSTDSVMKDASLVANSKGALMMSIRLSGQFGSDVNRTMALAAAMLNEILRSMFPSAADAVAVCPLLHKEFSDEDSQMILRKQPRITIAGEHPLFSQTDFELVIIEDSASDLGVVTALMGAGDDVMRTLFSPVFNYLNWYADATVKSDYLYYGLDHEPACFDFTSLGKLAKILGDDGHKMQFVDIDSLVEYDVCDFCGRRYAKGDHVTVLEDGRIMCRECAENLAGNNKKVLKAHLDRAKIFLESTYGIRLDDDYEFCFESTVKIANTLKQDSSLRRRGSDVPLKAYLDDHKKVHVEYSIPSVSLSELLVRELTHVWQLKNLPDISEDLAEGHIALVSIQYLRFLNQRTLAGVRTTYYETTRNLSGEGYRKLIRVLLANPQYHNNPFRYLLDLSGQGSGEQITPPAPQIIETGDYGLPYTPGQPDRALDGNLNYFYRSRLTATHQDAYDTLLAAIEAHADQVTLAGCRSREITKIMTAVAYDHPELFYFNTVSDGDEHVRLFYGASAEDAAVLQRRIDEVVPRYLEGIDNSMSAYDAAIRIHARIISAVDYDSIALSRQQQEGGPKVDKIDYLRTICGVFLEGKAVCEGYARAMQYLLHRCGIECAECAGYIRKESGEQDGGHAWNILKLDGDYYYLDTTWDDSSNTTQTVKKTELGFNYFCITTEELTRTRDVDLCPTDMPACTATRGNYYYHNDLVLNQYDLNKIKLIAQTAARSNSKSFTFKCGTKAVFEDALNQLCAIGQDCYEVLKSAAKLDKQILTNSYLYSYDPHIQTITVRFKYKTSSKNAF